MSMFLRAVALAALGASFGSAVHADPGSLRLRVRCDRGETLTRALAWLPPGKVLVEFQGACVERVVIGRDDVTVRGIGAAPTLEGSVAIRGASRVRLEGFTVRDTVGPDPFEDEGDGVKIFHSQDVSLVGLTIQDTGRRGITLEQSSVDLEGNLVQRTGGNGMSSLSSVVNFRGVNTFRQSQIEGLGAAFGSTFFLRRGAQVLSTDHALAGFTIQNNSSLILSDDALVAAERNAFAGLVVVSNSVFLQGVSEVRCQSNGLFGVLVAESSSWSPSTGSASSVVVSGNGGAGIVVTTQGGARFEPGTVVQGNGSSGVVVINGSASLGGVAVSGNRGNAVFAAFGSKLELLANNTFEGPVACDATVLTRGVRGCDPAAAPTLDVDSISEEIARALPRLRARR
jgi:hypothetical protein